VTKALSIYALIASALASLVFEAERDKSISISVLFILLYQIAPGCIVTAPELFTLASPDIFLFQKEPYD